MEATSQQAEPTLEEDLASFDPMLAFPDPICAIEPFDVSELVSMMGSFRSDHPVSAIQPSLEGMSSMGSFQSDLEPSLPPSPSPNVFSSTNTSPVPSRSPGSRSGSAGSTGRRRRGSTGSKRNRKRPERESFATDAEFEAGLQIWRQRRDANNASVRRSRGKEQRRWSSVEKTNHKLSSTLDHLKVELREARALARRAVEQPFTLSQRQLSLIDTWQDDDLGSWKDPYATTSP